jgi:FkbM family methyltransferase
MNKLKRLIAMLLDKVGYSIRSSGDLHKLEEASRLGRAVKIFSDSPLAENISLNQLMKIHAESKSQLGQDVLALARTGLGVPGFFVEFGATNGKDLSNTFMLEKYYNWRGILCEPGKKWEESLKANRNCDIDLRCVYTKTGDLVNFSETQIGELSTLTELVRKDANAPLRKTLEKYKVETVSLEDLLLDYKAPKHIDFLSIDTEGSEFEILNAFDFRKYSFGVICVEHNFTINRDKIRALLEGNGYKQVHVELSEFDDWFVLDSEPQN